VTKVRPGSAAERGGLEGGDIITMYGGYPVVSLENLGMLLEKLDPGDSIPVQILRITPDGTMRGETALQAQ